MGKTIEELTSVKEIRTENWLCVSGSKFFKYNGKGLENFTNTAGLISNNEMAIKFFDENNNII